MEELRLNNDSESESSSEDELEVHESLLPFPIPHRDHDFTIPALDGFLGEEDTEVIVFDRTPLDNPFYTMHYPIRIARPAPARQEPNQDYQPEGYQGLST